MKSLSAIAVVQTPLVRRRDFELEFLPAALEIVETPASPAGRAIGATVILFFCMALAWASWSTVDIVASAPGRIIPNGRTKVVQPFEIGVVRAIRVHDGQNVKVGDVLIELDPTINDAEREHSQSDLLAAQLEVARLRATLTTGRDPLASFEPPAGASPALVTTQRQFLLNQITEQDAKLAALERQQGQKEAERATSAAAVNKIERLIPVLQQQLEIRKTLFEHETGSKLNYLQATQALIEQHQDLEVQRSRQLEAEAAVAAIKETRAQAVAEYRRARYEELTKAEQKAAGLAQDLVKAHKRTALQLITAPVDGVVQQLAVHTVGGIVTPAQPLLVVVPAEDRLEIEATVSNQDIGFVQVGQEAEIKVQTFNFTRYGLLHGQVLTLSEDSVGRDPAQSSEKPQGSDSRTGRTSDVPDPGYSARISLDRTRMQIEDKLVNLSPGMAVTVEIKTGSRSIISYLLSPLGKYKQESLRER
jgi:hemolysin D